MSQQTPEFQTISFYHKNETSIIHHEYHEIYDFDSIQFNYRNNISKLGKYINSNSSLGSNLQESCFETKAEYNKNQLIGIIKSDCYIEGDISKTQLFLEKIHRENHVLFASVFEKTYLYLFKEKNSTLLSDFIKNIAAIDYCCIKEKAASLIISGLAHADTLVNEASLRAVEYWGASDLVPYLTQIRRFEQDWLEDYKNDVIEYLRGVK